MMAKELLIYLAIVLVSSLLFHPDLLTEPLQRLSWMHDHANYYHPLLFGLGIYLLIGIPRLLYFGTLKVIAYFKSQNPH